MRLKTFQAKTMTEAMRQIKEALGDDAIIVNSRDAPGGMIRVTAAVEQQNPDFADTLAMAARDDLFSEEEVLEIVTDTLLKHRVPGTVIEKVVSNAILVASNDPKETLTRAIEKSFIFGEAPEDAGLPLMLVGPPGAGKTLMTAKLAARAVMNEETPTVITTDIARAGGIEQLSAFLDILGVELQQAEDVKTLKALLADAEGTVIIDTGGLNPFDPQEMKTLARLMTAAKMETALVLPAGFDAEESAEIAMTFDVLGVRRLIPTRLDFARRIGGILAAADKGGLSFGEASHTPQVADGIVMLTPEKLAGFLMPYTPKKSAKPVKTEKRGKR
ncbi:MAG: GTPase [Alphaproteobacteria bacterium]